MPGPDTIPLRTVGPPRLTFVHIPKTAGASILQALTRLYDQSRVSPFIYEGKTEIERPEAYDLFSGHMGFTMAKTFDAPIATILRDPVDRIVSLYHFWRTRTPSLIPDGMSLDDFVKSQHPGIMVNVRNTQTWQLDHSLRLPEQKKLHLSRGALLARAMSNLKEVTVVGVFSKMDLFSRDLSAFLGQDLQQLPRVNVMRDRTLREPISEHSRALIMQVSDLDQLLYEFAVSRVDDRRISHSTVV